jgi:hypothetical protein
MRSLVGPARTSGPLAGPLAGRRVRVATGEQVQSGQDLERGVPPGPEQLSRFGVEAQRAADGAGLRVAAEVGAAADLLQRPVRAVQRGGGAGPAQRGLGGDLGGSAAHHPVAVEAVDGAAGLGHGLGDAGELREWFEGVHGRSAHAPSVRNARAGSRSGWPGRFGSRQRLLTRKGQSYVKPDHWMLFDRYHDAIGDDNAFQ